MSPPRRVLVLCRNFPPEVSAGSFRLLRWAKYFRSAGWDPHFLAMADDWGDAHHDPGLAAEVPAEVAVDRVSSWAPEERFDRFFGRGRFAPPASGMALSALRRPSLRSRLAGALRPIWALMLRTPDPAVWWLVPAVRRGLRLARRRRLSAILSTGPPHSVHLAGVWLKRLTGLPLVVDLRDPWAVPSFGPERNPLGRRLLGRFQARVFQLADRVVLNTPRAKTFYAARYPRQRSKLAAITNGFDAAYRQDVRPVRSGAAPWLVCHPGDLYGPRDVRPFLAALAELVEEGLDLRFEQVGWHEPRFELQRSLAALRLEGRVELLSRTSHEQMLNRMSAADLFLVVQPDAPLMVPAKTYEMMLFDKPILALTGEGATADLIGEHGLGAVAGAADVAAIRRALRRLVGRLSAPASAQAREGRTRRNRLKRFDGRSLSGEMAALLDGLLDGRESRAR